MEELINALKVIRDVCNDSKDGCKNCPLSGHSDECLVNESIPECWDIKNKPVQKILL